MRLHPALLSAGLLGSLCEAARAPVYIGGYSAQSSDAVALSYDDARLFLAEQLDLAQEYGLETASDDLIKLLNQDGNLQKPLFRPAKGVNGGQRRMVVVEGVDTEKWFDTKSPAFYIDSTFDMGQNLNLVSSFLEQDRKNTGSANFCGGGISTMNVKDSIQGGFSSTDPLGYCSLNSIQGSEWWRSLSLKDKVDLLTASHLELNRKIWNEEIPDWKYGGITAIFHVSTLSDIADTSGTSSAEYHEAAQEIQSSLQNLLQNSGSCIVVLVPYSKGSKGKRSFLAANEPSPARVQRQQLSFAEDAPTSFPKTTIPACYSEQAACEAATASCSGHGQCTLKWTETDSNDEKGPECWGCVCNASIIRAPDSQGRGGKSISWGGPACQKKDISVPFWLFAGFGVALAAAISCAVGMMYSVGDSELPSVLGAGVASVGARGK